MKTMQFLKDLKKAAKGERADEFSFDDDGEKGKADKWLEKLNNVSKKIQAAPAAAKEKMQKMREPKDEEKALYFEEAEQEKAKAATWWSGCDPKEDPDVRQWSRSASSETVQSHANAESISSGDETWYEEESEGEALEADPKNGALRMSQVDFEALQGGSVTPLEPIKEVPEKPKAKDPFGSSGEAQQKPKKVEEKAKDPFGSSGDEEPAQKPQVEERKPKKGKKPMRKAPAKAQDPFADSDSDRGYPKGAAKAPADPFADSDHETETGPLLPGAPLEAKTKRPSQVPASSETESKSLSSSDPPKKVKRPKGRPKKEARPSESLAEDGSASTSSKKPVGRPKKKAPAQVAAQDSDGEDAKF